MTSRHIARPFQFSYFGSKKELKRKILNEIFLASVRRVAFCLIALFTSFPATVMAESYAIFSANASFPEISESKAKMIFIGKAKSIAPVGKVVLVNWPKGSDERKGFYKTLLNKTSAQVNSKWASLAFSGKAKPPRELREASPEELTIWLEQNPKGIAYAPADAVPEGVNILLMIN